MMSKQLLIAPLKQIELVTSFLVFVVSVCRYCYGCLIKLVTMPMPPRGAGVMTTFKGKNRDTGE